MNKRFILFIPLALLSTAALAQQPPAQYMPSAPPAVTQPTTTEVPTPQPSPMESGLAQLQQQWAIVKYQTPDHEQQEQAVEKLAAQAQQLVAQFPGTAEPLIWQGIVLATKAGIDGGLGALGEAKAARSSLEAAEKIDPKALNGSVYTSLGSLYYKVPGWPVGFGDDDKAKAYLEKALAMNPDGIDPNFFYGEFLYEDGDYAHAKTALEHGLQAPPRPGRELADKGRAEEIRDLLAKVQKKLKN